MTKLIKLKNRWLFFIFIQNCFNKLLRTHKILLCFSKKIFRFLILFNLFIINRDVAQYLFLGNARNIPLNYLRNLIVGFKKIGFNSILKEKTFSILFMEYENSVYKLYFSSFKKNDICINVIIEDGSVKIDDGSGEIKISYKKDETHSIAKVC